MRPRIFLGILITSAHAYAQALPETDEEPVSEAPVTPTSTVDITAPPSAGKGVIVGVVRDNGDKTPVAEAEVTLVGKGIVVHTDSEGRFRIEAPPGSYTLRVFADFYKPIQVRNVRCGQGRIATLSPTLTPDATAIEEAVAVEAEAERASMSTQLLLRKKDASSSDGVSAQEIARGADRNAADALKRVVGTSIVDGKYVVVLGLGDRYMSARLNGSPLPSPEPDRQAVPLDMFPTLVLSDLTVRKTFTPDLPGDFTGGLVEVHTRDIPSDFMFMASVNLGANSQTTFQSRLTYPGGSLDALGIDDGTRSIPSEIPAERLVELDPNTGQRRDLSPYAKALAARKRETETAFTLPSGSLSLALGDTWKPKPGSMFNKVFDSVGFLVGASYSRRFLTRRDETIRVYGLDGTPARGLLPITDYRATTSSDSVGWSSLGELGVTFNPRNRVYVTGFVTRAADKEGRIIEGFNQDANANVRDERIRFQNRALLYGQVRGEHTFESLNRSILRWRALQARATSGDPDLRETIYTQNAGGTFAFRDGTLSGQHFFANQGETSRAVGLDYSQPLGKNPDKPRTLSAGGLLSLRGRSFGSRRLRFQRRSGSDPSAYTQSPNSLFNPDTIASRFDLIEETKATDTYDARYDVTAGYVMTDLTVRRGVRLVMGTRIEAATQSIDSFDPFAGTSNAQESSVKKNTDLLPALSVILTPKETFNLRLAYGRTVARPQLRELAPFIFTNYLGAREEFGNPNLERTRIDNLDIRAEYFPGPEEVLAATLFYKRFLNPIEPTVIQTTRGVDSYDNALSGTSFGLELEGRKRLTFLAAALREFSLVGNLTLLSSKVELDPAKLGGLTSLSRPIAGQAPFVVNAALDWEHDKTRARILYNVAGARIYRVGAFGLPDIYERPRHVIDVAVAHRISEHVDAKLSIENLLNAPYRLTHGDASDAALTNRWTVGQSLWIGATYTH